MSFSQEMKDFVSGWGAVNDMVNKKKEIELHKQELEDMKQYRSDTIDLQRQELDLKREAQSRRLALAGSGSTRASDKAAAAVAEAVLKGVDVSGYTPEGGDTSGGNTDTVDTAPDYPADAAIPEDPVSMNYRGGMVQRFAAGGVVDPAANDGLIVPKEDTAPVIPKLPARSAIPTQPATSAATTAAPQQTEAATAAPKTSLVLDASLQAMKDAAPSLIADAKAARTGTGNPATDIATNKGGLSTEEWQAAVKAIDPNGEIPSYMQGAAVLGSTYRYFVEHGQMDKARKIAKAIIIADKQMTQTLGALAVNAIQNGNEDAAIKLMGDAFNRFPTGHEVKVVKQPDGSIGYVVTEGGKTVQQGSLNTQQFWQLANKVQDGSLYIQQMGSVASSGGQKQGGSYAESLQAVSDAAAQTRAAKQQYDAITTEGANGDAEAALKAWREADVAERAAKAAALKAGRQTYTEKTNVTTADAELMRSIQSAAESKSQAVPAAPSGETASASADGGQGWGEWALNRATSITNPVAAAINAVEDAKSVYNYLGGNQPTSAIPDGQSAAQPQTQQQTQQQDAPQINEIVPYQGKNYRFLGGDPSNPDSWEAVP